MSSNRLERLQLEAQPTTPPIQIEWKGSLYEVQDYLRQNMSEQERRERFGGIITVREIDWTPDKSGVSEAQICAGFYASKEVYPHLHDPPLTAEAFYSAAGPGGAEHKLVLVAVDKQQPQGVIFVRTPKRLGINRVWFTSFAVNPEAWGRHIGRTLIEQALLISFTRRLHYGRFCRGLIESAVIQNVPHYEVTNTLHEHVGFKFENENREVVPEVPFEHRFQAQQFLRSLSEEEYIKISNPVRRYGIYFDEWLKYAQEGRYRSYRVAKIPRLL